MARLEAARLVAAGKPSADVRAGGLGHRPGADTSNAAPAAPEIPAKPAHLLVAQLEEEESRRHQANADRMQARYEAAAPEQAIAQVEVAVAPPKPTRRMPEWVWAAVVAVLVVGGLSYAYTQAQREPEPIAEVDPAKRAEAERKKRALTALQQGHQAVLDEKHDAAIARYKQALSLEPNLASAERGLGIAYAAKGDRRTAIVHYQRFIELEPDTLEAAKIKAIIRDYRKRRRTSHSR